MQCFGAVNWSGWCGLVCHMTINWLKLKGWFGAFNELQEKKPWFGAVNEQHFEQIAWFGAVNG